MYLIIFLLLVYTSGYYLAITQFGSVLVPIVLLIGIALLLIRGGQRLMLSLSTLIYSLFFILAIIISSYVNNDLLSLSSLKQILIIVFALLFVSSIKWEMFKAQYVDAIFLICLMALFGLFLCNTPAISFFPHVYNYNGVEYVSGVFFSNIINTFTGLTYRLHGLFWEPGLFSSYVLLALIFLEKRSHCSDWLYFLKFFVFCLCVVLSSSGASVILFPIAIGLHFLKNYPSLSSIKNSKLIVIFLILFLSLLIVSLIYKTEIEEWVYDIFLDKLLDPQNSSSSTRFNAVLVDFKIFLSNLPFGVGIGNYASSVRQYAIILLSSGTSTLTMLLAQFGVLGVPILIVIIINLSKLIDSDNLFLRVLFLTFMFVVLFKEPHGSLSLMNILIMYAIDLNNKNLSNRYLLEKI